MTSTTHSTLPKLHYRSSLVQVDRLVGSIKSEHNPIGSVCGFHFFQLDRNLAVANANTTRSHGMDSRQLQVFNLQLRAYDFESLSFNWRAKNHSSWSIFFKVCKSNKLFNLGTMDLFAYFKQICMLCVKSYQMIFTVI